MAIHLSNLLINHNRVLRGCHATFGASIRQVTIIIHIIMHKYEHGKKHGCRICIRHKLAKIKFFRKQMWRSTRFNSWAIFFIVFINDHYLYPNLKDISLFADDATTHHKRKCTQIITQQLQNVATSANRWCENNKMKLSIIKTKVALVDFKQRLNRITDSDKQIKIISNDIAIEQVSHSKFTLINRCHGNCR